MIIRANDVARAFADERPDVIAIEPPEKNIEIKDVVGHFSHKENIEIAQWMKKSFALALKAPDGSDADPR